MSKFENMQGLDLTTGVYEKELTMETVIDYKFRGAIERTTLGDFYDEDIHGTTEDYFEFIRAWLVSGRASIVQTNKKKAEQIADNIAQELLTVKQAADIQQDRVERINYSASSRGVYKKVGFPAKTLIDAQEMQQMLMKNYNFKTEDLGILITGNDITVTISNCPVKTYASLERTLGLKRATESIANVVDKTASGVLNTADMALNNVAVPVAKTTIGTTAKAAKSVVGFAAKLGGIFIGEATKATKQCIQEIKTDGYITEARGEVTSGIQSMRRTMGNKTFGGARGTIIE